MAQEITQVPAKEKDPTQIKPNGLTKCADSGTMVCVNGKPLSAASVTSAPSVVETTPSSECTKKD